MDNKELKAIISRAEDSLNEAISFHEKAIIGIQSHSDTLFDALFDLVEKPAAPAPKATKQTFSNMPFDDLLAGPIEIVYRARTQNSMVPFMDFDTAARRFLDTLINDLRSIGKYGPKDLLVMDSPAKARRDSRGKQTWYDFIVGLQEDKVVTGKDFSESQMFQLGQLINDLSKGTKLNGCFALTFCEKTTGKSL